MKKLSISFFAVLAIAFAVTSAFTTKTNGKTALGLSNRFGLIGTTQAVVGRTASNVISNKVTSPFSGIRYDSNTDLSYTTTTQLDTWMSNNPVIDGSDTYALSCNTNADLVCFAYVDSGDPVGTGTIKIYKTGDFAFVLQ